MKKWLNHWNRNPMFLYMASTMIAILVAEVVIVQVPAVSFRTIKVLLDTVIHAVLTLPILYVLQRRISVELKKTEDEMLRASNLEAIGKLAVGVAHEINNPLANASMNIQILKHRLIRECNPDEKLIKRIEAVDSSIGRVSAISRELLQLSRRSKFEFEPLNLNEIVESAVIQIEHRLEDVRVNQNYRIIPTVNGDPVKLEQVFINILNNAVEAMSDGGTIDISTSRGDGYVNVEISDTGEGIDEDNILKIFEPFFTTKAAGSGTGLGLSICYGIVSHHEGIIDIASTVNKGSKVTVRLPFKEE